jgi:hypothetical protein
VTGRSVLVAPKASTSWEGTTEVVAQSATTS